GSDDVLDHATIAIDDEGFRVAGHAVTQRYHAFAIQEYREGQARLLYEGLDGGQAVLIFTDGEHDKILALHATIQPLHRGHLFSTRRAPGRPDVQHHALAPQVGEPLLAAVETLEAEIRSWKTDAPASLLLLVVKGACQCHEQKGERQPPPSHLFATLTGVAT